MPKHKNLIESLADDRHSDRYRRAPGRRVTAPAEAMRHTRSRAGWLLEGIWLRLALPGNQDRAHTTTLLGR
jgi:hypothetical protein